jgi:triacylglycerol lipase
VRGEQLITQLEEFAAISASSRFHLVGHSLGGPTIRYAAENRPDLVISATTISGVNHGSQAADNESLELPLVRGIISFMGNALGHVIDTVSQASFEQNILAATDAMSPEGIAAFNGQYPTALPAVYCNGAEGMPDAGFSHGSANPDYVENNPINSFDDFAPYYANAVGGSEAGPYSLIYDGDGMSYDVYFFSFGGNQAATNTMDPLDGLHKAVSRLIDGDDDDGFVERCSMHLGYVVKDNFPMNHLDYMNWFVGLRDKNAPYAPSIYRAHFHFMKNFEIAEGL